jgi:hypothetical protein
MEQNFVILAGVLIIIGLIVSLQPSFLHISEILLIPIVLYLLLIPTKIIKDMEFFAIICIGTIAIHLVINIILRKYGNGDNIENFSIKLDSFKNSDKTKNIKFSNRLKLQKKEKNNGKNGKNDNGKNGKNKNRKEKNGGNSEKFSNSPKNANIYTVGNIKSDSVDYYNSFSNSIMNKKSKSTGESIGKFGFLKDKFLEIFQGDD